MGKNKTKSEQATKNTFSFLTPPGSPDVQSIRDWTPQIDPGISYSFGRARNQMRNTLANPLGADTPAAVRDAVLMAGDQELAQQEAQALREAGNDVNQAELQKRIAAAGFTEPRLVQTFGQTTGSTQQGGGLGSALSGIASVGLALL